MIDKSRRAARAAGIDTHACVAMRHPLLGVHYLPDLIFVRRAEGHIRVTCDHVLPGAWIALLKGKPLGIRAVSEQDGPPSLGRRPEYVRPNHHAVIHRDPDVPIDEHVVPLNRLGHLPTPLKSELYDGRFSLGFPWN